MPNTDDVQLLRAARAGLRSVFLDFSASPDGASPVFFESSAEPLIGTFYRVLALAETALAEVQAPEPDVIDGINALVAMTPGKTLAGALEDEFFELVTRRGLVLTRWTNLRHPVSVQLEFYRKHFLAALSGVPVLQRMADPDGRLNPAAKGCLAGGSVLSASVPEILAVAALRDPFAAGRTYRYRGDGTFEPVTLEGVTDPSQFYGFHSVRHNFSEHLNAFVAGKTRVPLMVSSLPGLGKTRFSISYTLSHPELTLIFAEPETLSSGLDELIDKLQCRKRKFVIFFDDIEPAKIEWYGFRTNVGGSATLPENISFILASNDAFPINILSRGREITFPVFDEVRCQEMVEDFLAEMGMRHDCENLASVIAAGYVEDFGQKKFTELSPRTLVRYLQQFRHDGALRKRMLAQSHQEMIVKPDAQIFYDFNIRTLRSLYGDGYIDAMREEKLKALGDPGF